MQQYNIKIKYKQYTNKNKQYTNKTLFSFYHM